MSIEMERQFMTELAETLNHRDIKWISPSSVYFRIDEDTNKVILDDEEMLNEFEEEIKALFKRRNAPIQLQGAKQSLNRYTLLKEEGGESEKEKRSTRARTPARRRSRKKVGCCCWWR